MIFAFIIQGLEVMLQLTISDTRMSQTRFWCQLIRSMRVRDKLGGPQVIKFLLSLSWVIIDNVYT